MQALEIQGIKMQALLTAMHLFFSICGIQHALCFKNYCHYSASISPCQCEHRSTVAYFPLSKNPKGFQ